MRVLKWFAALVIVVIAAGALLLWTGGESAKLSEMAGYGPKPELPAPNATLVPTINQANGIGWPAGAKPIPAAGLSVAAFADKLDTRGGSTSCPMATCCWPRPTRRPSPTT